MDGSSFLRTPTRSSPSRCRIALYRKHAEVYFRRQDGTHTHEILNLECTVRPLLDLYRELPAAEFRLRGLEEVREPTITSGLARKTVNDRVWRILRIIS